MTLVASATKIAFTSARDAREESDVDVYVMEADGATVIRLTHNPVLMVLPPGNGKGSQQNTFQGMV